MNNKRMRGAPAISTSLTAAALQNHLSLQLSLSPGLKTAAHTPLHTTGSGAGRQKKTKVAAVTRESERERVLDEAPPPLSLAEKLGLVPRPPPLLTASDWHRVKKISRERQDSTHPCPICQEPFGARQQVLLSCSHVFHRLCLRSVERFSGHKTCPLCRHSNYQTRLIYDGLTHHRHQCAARIQAWWRGVRVRLWYQKVREKVPPQNPTLRHSFYHKKLTSITTKMVESCTRSSSAAEDVLAAADSALATVRATMRSLDYHALFADTDWSSLSARAITAATTADCPICISPLIPPQTTPPGHTHCGRRPLSLLSCGHVLHLSCVSSLEQFCTSDTALPLCPLCRAPYSKRPLHFPS